MLVRYTTLETDEQSNALQGIFMAISTLRDKNALATHEEEVALASLRWLGMHLKSPTCLQDPENYRAICWFKDTAKEPLRRVRDLIPILEDHEVHVQMHTTNDPGVLMFVDGWQVVAMPRKKKSNNNLQVTQKPLACG